MQSPAQQPPLRCRDSFGGAGYTIFAADSGVPAFLSDAAQVQTLVAGYYGACAVRTDHSVYCTPGAPAFLQQATNLGPVVDLCASENWACAVLVGGGLRCWGEQAGWLPTTPTAVAGAWSQARGVTCGQSHACFWSGTNGVQCIGTNNSGQLGRDGPGSSTAVAIPMEERVEEVSAAARHSCARLASGHIRCWGDNHHAQLGLRALIRSDLPVELLE
jgi:alpha-tubulin suppressor-like RCC1 family protein